MKTINLFIGMLLYTTAFWAQTNYYTTTKTINENGYVYQCDVSEGSGFVTLYNKGNKIIEFNQKNRYTGESTSMEDNMTKKNLEDDTWTKPKCYSIVNNAFSDAQKQRVKGQKGLMIYMYINPDSGKVFEVKFKFVNFGPYATIPVSVYRNIETEIKKNIWFTPTERGKKLNYIFRGWLHQVL